MVNYLVFRWPEPSFFMVLRAHGRQIPPEMKGVWFFVCFCMFEPLFFHSFGGSWNEMPIKSAPFASGNFGNPFQTTRNELPELLCVGNEERIFGGHIIQYILIRYVRMISYNIACMIDPSIYVSIIFLSDLSISFRATAKTNPIYQIL